MAFEVAVLGLWNLFFFQQRRPDNLTRHLFCYKLLCFTIFKFILKHIWPHESTKPSEITLSGTNTSTENSRSIIYLHVTFSNLLQRSTGTSDVFPAVYR